MPFVTGVAVTAGRHPGVYLDTTWGGTLDAVHQSALLALDQRRGALGCYSARAAAKLLHGSTVKSGQSPDTPLRV